MFLCLDRFRLGAVLYYSLNYLRVFVAIYVVRKCKKLRRSRSGHRVLLCYGLIFGKAVCLQTYCWRNVFDGDCGDDFGFTEDTGLFCVTVVCVCMYTSIMNFIGQMCSRSSMMFCHVHYGFRVLC
jgi:hypothetical protein